MRHQGSLGSAFLFHPWQCNPWRVFFHFHTIPWILTKHVLLYFLRVFFSVITYYASVILQGDHIRCKVRNCFCSIFLSRNLENICWIQTLSKLCSSNLPSKIKMDAHMPIGYAAFVWIIAKDFQGLSNSIKTKVNFPLIIPPAYFFKII